jgi:(1->4)-alpha-D-glucan 1-alpha-D-glucosylmutase
MGPGLAELRERMDAYMRKAVREAKSRTSWTDPDADYQTAVSKFVETVLTEEGPGTFLADFQRTCAPIWAAGAINGLAQTAIKLMAPGVPDIYQGTEFWDFSLVDPDNRAPVDFAARQELLRFVAEASPEELLAHWRTGAPKLALMAAGLRLRGKFPRLFADGDYEPLAAHGKASGNVVGFCRRFAADAALAIVPRFVLELSPELETPELEAGLWQDTMIRLPGAEVRHLTDVLTGETFEPGATVPVSKVLARFPVALLSAGVSD